MAEQLFDTNLGYSVSNDETGEAVWSFVVLTGIPGDPGLPAEELTRSNEVKQGSWAVNIASGLEYRKIGAGSGADKWELKPTQAAITQAVGGDSWLDPVILKDETVYVNLAAAEAAINTGVLQTVTLLDQHRIVFTGITGEDKDVFVINGTPGSGATLVQDGDGPSNNDVVRVDEGDCAGHELHYNATDGTWKRSNQPTKDEFGFIHAYVGKTGEGSEFPDFSSNHFINDGDNLTLAAGKHDAQIKLNETAAASALSLATTNLNEINALETALGAMINSDGTYIARTDTNYLDGNASADEDFRDIDALLKTNTDAITLAANTVTDLQTEVDAIETSLGALVGADGIYVARTDTNYLDGNASADEDFRDLDGLVKANADAIAAGAAQEVKVTGVTTLQEIDSVLVDDVRSVEWMFDARQGNKVRSYLVYATHDGTLAADAVDKKWDRFSKQRMNGSISGFDIDVELEGSGPTQKLALKAEAGSAIDVAVRRFEVTW